MDRKCCKFTLTKNRYALHGDFLLLMNLITPLIVKQKKTINLLIKSKPSSIFRICER